VQRRAGRALLRFHHRSALQGKTALAVMVQAVIVLAVTVLAVTVLAVMMLDK
jgi:hypothetical protein